MNQSVPRGPVPLGKSGILVPPMGLGTWPWGDRAYWGYGRSYTDADLKASFDAALNAGIAFFDTAEIYGQGRSEDLLGRFIRASGQPVTIATKFFPYPWRLRRGDLLRALKGSLRRLGLERVDLYMTHFQLPPVSIEARMDALADAVEAGLARAAGVSNYNVAQMRRAHAALARRGVPLASNQVAFSLLQRKPERSGLLDACRELGVALVAYSPLAQGMLTGKYTTANRPPGPRRFLKRRYLARAQGIVEVLRRVGEAHGGKTPAQVALNWLMCKGAVPIPGAKTPRQVEENAGALGWRLSEAEVAALDEASGQS